MMTEHDIILVNPPYGTMANPYIAVPALHAYLKEKGIDIFSRDLNSLLYKELARPDHVRQGIAHVKKRFTELNDGDRLNFAESIEYKTYATLLFQLSCHGQALTDFVKQDYSFDAFKQVRFNKLLITASSAPSFPEMILTTPQFAVNPLSESFSVSGILDSLADSNGVMDSVYNILDDILAAHDAPVWGFSVTFQEQITKAFQCAAYIKRKKPAVFIIMGGPSVSSYFRNFPDTRLFSIVDAFAYYEGEQTLSSLVDTLKSQRSLQEVPGISFLDQGKIRYTQPPEPIPINQTVVPDYEAVNPDDFLTERKDMTVPIRLTKGCAWGRCTFCSSYHSTYQEIDPERALNQLLTIYHHTGIRNIMFSDDAAPLRILDYLSDKIIELGLSISWTFHTRITGKLTQARCEQYKKAGCRQVYVGVESTSDRILKKMDKGITFENIRSFFNTMYPDLPIMAYMMIGFPGEREEEAKKGFEYLNQLIEQKKLTSYVYSQFTVKPGSAIWENPQDFGISDLRMRRDLDLDHNEYCFTSNGMPLEKVYDYYCEFSGKAEFDRIFSKVKAIRFQDLDEPLNFTMKDLSDFVSSNTDFFYKPMAEWFSNPSTLQRTTEFSW